MSKNRITYNEKFMQATPEYPDGSYLLEVAGVVHIATGHYAKLYPGKPSPYWHGGPPIHIIDTSEWETWPWDRYGTK